MQSVLLIVHVLGAGYVLLVILRSLSASWFSDYAELPNFVRILSIGLLFEILTGGVLAVTSEHYSTVTFCKNIALYTTIISATVFVLYRKMRTVGEVSHFPLRFVGVASLMMGLMVPLFVLGIAV